MCSSDLLPRRPLNPLLLPPIQQLRRSASPWTPRRRHPPLCHPRRSHHPQRRIFFHGNRRSSVRVQPLASSGRGDCPSWRSWWFESCPNHRPCPCGSASGAAITLPQHQPRVPCAMSRAPAARRLTPATRPPHSAAASSAPGRSPGRQAARVAGTMAAQPSCKTDWNMAFPPGWKMGWNHCYYVF